MGFDKCNNVVYSLRENGNRNWASTDQYPYPNKQRVTGVAYIGLSPLSGGNDVMFLYLVQTPLFFINTGKFDLTIPYKGQGFSMSTQIKGIHVGLSNTGGEGMGFLYCNNVTYSVRLTGSMNSGTTLQYPHPRNNRPQDGKMYGLSPREVALPSSSIHSR